MTNRVSRTCRLYGARITRYNALVTSVGYRSYDTCRATNAFGTICSQNSNCVLANTVCIDLTCQCDAGWCYSPNSLSCVRACVQYGDMFTKFVHSYISGNNLIALSAAQYLTPTGCGSACVNTTSFVCLSFELDYTFNKCYLQSVTPFLVSLLDFLRLLTSDTDYYQRHCKYLPGA
ncbi:unnamed protein product [Lymnaea stagnalis]|uniref:Apple domain-containing protein n=1 Tax=Lymnaea stagnalis TaxID=6523 RepID=A0AAV2HSG9_LYMST